MVQINISTILQPKPVYLFSKEIVSWIINTWMRLLMYFSLVCPQLEYIQVWSGQTDIEKSEKINRKATRFVACNCNLTCSSTLNHQSNSRVFLLFKILCNFTCPRLSDIISHIITTMATKFLRGSYPNNILFHFPRPTHINAHLVQMFAKLE